jgi:molybdenum cofactor biosynthesis enzyme MoaA
VAFPVAEYEKAAAANAEKILEQVTETAKRIGIACETRHIKDQFAAEGKLRLCLFDDLEIDLRTPLRAGASAEEIEALFRQAILTKPERHHLEVGRSSCSLRALSQIGG